jgi:hypothetical protein
VPARRSPSTTAVGAVLLVLAGLLTSLTVATAWLRAEVLDPDAWTGTTATVIQDPVVRADVAALLAERVVDAVDIEGRLGALLPFPLGGLAGPLDDGATDLVARGTEALVGTDAFAGVWEDASRAAWTEVVRSLRGEGRATAVVGGALVLDLEASLGLLRDQLVASGVPLVDDVDLSVVDAQFVLVEAPELERLERLVLAFDVAVVAFPAVAVLAGLAGVVLVRRVGIVLVAVGAGVVVGAGVGAVVASIARRIGTDVLAGGILGEEAARRVVASVASGVSGPILASAGVGVVVALLGAVVWAASAGARPPRA